MKHIIAILCIAYFSQFVNAQTEQRGKAKAPVYSQEVFQNPDKTFGYDIYADRKKIVHQPSIPALQGNKGFKTNAQAQKVAALVISKIKKGEMPPTITIDEMKKLNVL